MAYSKLRGAKNRKNKAKETGQVAEYDAFQEQSKKLIEKLLAHPYFIFGTVVAIILIVAIGLTISSKLNAKHNEHAYVFSKAVEQFNSEEEGDSGDKYKKSIELFSEILKTQSGINVQASYVYIGKAHYRLKKFDKAIEVFKKARDMKNLDTNLLFSAYEGEALCYLDRKEFDKAVSLWKEWLNKPTNFYKDYALYYIGYSFEKSGKNKDALVYYKRLKDEFPKSMLVAKVIDKLPAEKTETPNNNKIES